MSTKTISITEEAYERLRANRHDRNDSFSRVVMRATWEKSEITAADLLELWRDAPPFLSLEALSNIETAKVAELPPEDKWNSH